MNLLLAAAAALVAGPAVSASAAQPTAVDGCQAGDLCGYSSAAGLAAGGPAMRLRVAPETIARGPVLIGWSGTLDESAYVDNAGPAYTSEGNYVDFHGLVCVYVPDSADEQAPGGIDSQADATHPVSVIAYGPTAASVDSPVLVSIGLGGCGGVLLSPWSGEGRRDPGSPAVGGVHRRGVRPRDGQVAGDPSPRWWPSSGAAGSAAPPRGRAGRGLRPSMRRSNRR
jgi:hypothetical protein